MAELHYRAKSINQQHAVVTHAPLACRSQLETHDEVDHGAV